MKEKIRQRRNKYGVKMVCNYADCNYSWKYNGEQMFFATCPNCLRKVKIKKIKAKKRIDKPLKKKKK